jgi:hypothetical protein
MSPQQTIAHYRITAKLGDVGAERHRGLQEHRIVTRNAGVTDSDSAGMISW